MCRLFEGGVYFVGGRHRGRRLFEGSVYSRATLKGAVRQVAHAHYDTLRSYKTWFQTRRYRDPGSRTRARIYFLQRKKMRHKLWVRVKSSLLLQGAPAWVQFLVEFQHGPSRPLRSCRDEARSSSIGASSSLLSTIYDRIDAAAAINFSTQFGAATIREWRLFESGVDFVCAGTGWKGEHKSTRIVYVLVLLHGKWRPRSSTSPFGRACKYRRLGSSLQPRVHSSISRYALEAGSARLARKMDTYITENLAELPKMLERWDTGEPMHVRTCTYLLLFSANSTSSRGDNSRAASISFRACSGAATIRERRLFESGIYSVIYGSCHAEPQSGWRHKTNLANWEADVRLYIAEAS